MLDEFKGAYGGITPPVHLIPTSGTILKPQLAWPCSPVFTKQASLLHIRTTASIALPLVLMFFCYSFSLSIIFLPIGLMFPSIALSL